MTDAEGFADLMNRLPEHVASRTLTNPTWNANVMQGDLAGGIERNAMTQPVSQGDISGRRAEHPAERPCEMSGIGEPGRVGRTGGSGAIRQVTSGTL